MGKFKITHDLAQNDAATGSGTLHELSRVLAAECSDPDR